MRPYQEALTPYLLQSPGELTVCLVGMAWSHLPTQVGWVSARLGIQAVAQFTVTTFSGNSRQSVYFAEPRNCSGKKRVFSKLDGFKYSHCNRRWDLYPH